MKMESEKMREDFVQLLLLLRLRKFSMTEVVNSTFNSRFSTFEPLQTSAKYSRQCGTLFRLQECLKVSEGSYCEGEARFGCLLLKILVRRRHSRGK